MIFGKAENGSTLGITMEHCYILEAIATLRCYEDFSLERFGLLGDFVLKFVRFIAFTIPAKT
ncbi:hypothetical protein Taro_039824 [Colocasia esculenta]|uniref:Uncharacterized protein n=1 Tax=Colocasia esculenta TaxID=4460 RepID=A0A843WAA8_COLES|nr:hypothetical protein [Colocasia esculenta]